MWEGTGFQATVMRSLTSSLGLLIPGLTLSNSMGLISMGPSLEMPLEASINLLHQLLRILRWCWSALCMSSTMGA